MTKDPGQALGKLAGPDIFPFRGAHPRASLGAKSAQPVALREISFAGGALALAASLTHQWRECGTHPRATIARSFVAIPVLFFSSEQFAHDNYVPAIPLNRLTPEWIYGHAVWTYLAALVYGVAGTLLLIGKKTRLAAAWLGLTVLFVELVVYLPIGMADRASFGSGLNFVADTLMFLRRGAAAVGRHAAPKPSRVGSFSLGQRSSPSSSLCRTCPRISPAGERMVCTFTYAAPSRSAPITLAKSAPGVMPWAFGPITLAAVKLPVAVPEVVPWHGGGFGVPAGGPPGCPAAGPHRNTMMPVASLGKPK